MRESTEAVFVGRDAERALLEAVLDEAVAGEGALVLLGGDAGIGKSRLCRELRRHAGTRGVHLVEGRCAGAESAVPYAPFLDAVRFRLARGERAAAAHVLGPLAPHLAPLLPELGAPRAPAAPDAAEARPFDHIFGVFERLADLGPVLVVLEDVHWADPTSLELLQYLARRVGTLPLLLVATYRTDELDLRHPLRRLVAAVAGERRVRRLVLPPLAEPEVARMIAGLAGQAPDDALATAIARRTEGNPFFVEELLRGLAAAGRLVPGGTLALARGDLPATVRETVLARLAPLGEHAFEVLRTAAVIGRTFDFDLLQRVTGLPEDDLLAVVERCVEQRVLVEEGGAGEDRLAFRHGLVQEVLCEQLLTRRRRRVHRAVAEALEALPPARQGLVADALAFHWGAAGDPERARRYGVRAGDQAARLHAWRDAEARYAAALARGPAGADAPAPDPAQEAELHEKLAYVAWWQGQAERALALGEEALARRRAVGDAGPLATALRYVGLLRAYQRGAWAVGTAMLREALALLPAGDTPERARLANDLGRLLAAQGAHDEARHWLRTALDVARAAGRPVEAAFALAKLGYLDVLAGRVQPGLEALEAARAQLPGLAPLPLDRGTGIYWAGIRALELARENARALAWLAEAGAYCARHGADAHRAIHELLRAAVERRRGRGEDVRALAWRAVAALRGAPRAEVRDALRVAGDLERVHGDPAAARRAYDEAITLGDVESRLGLAALLLAAHRAPEAAAQADAMLDALPDVPGPLRLQGLALAVEAHLAAGAPEAAERRLAALRAIVAATDHRAGPPTLQLAEAQVARGRAGPHAALPHLEAAAAGWQALGQPLEHARALGALACALADAGEGGERLSRAARAAVARLEAIGAGPEAARLRRQLRARGVRIRRAAPPAGGSPTPADAAPAGVLDALTIREREVLAHLGTGRTNKEIAHELGIAEKTVRIHVSHVLAKLGCATRTQAARVAFEAGLAAPLAGV